MNIYTSEKEMLKAQYSDIVSDGSLDPRDKFAKREWVGLTYEETEVLLDAHTSDAQGYDIWCDGRGVAAEVEAKLKEKNA